MGRLTVIGVDADDTLWHNERFFRLTQGEFARLLADYTDEDRLMERLVAAERRNLGRYGFGVKGFVLSMIETALEVTGDRVPGPAIARLIAAGHEMLSHPVELLPGVGDALQAVRDRRRLVLVTKGDLLDQERKLAQSGLGELFHGVEVVSMKDVPTYRAVFARQGDGAGRGLMAGNSLGSDVLPMIAAGGWGVHIPHPMTPEPDEPPGPDRFRSIATLSDLPPLLDRIDGD
jgi:putative hydrolase of the HAD superfamily